MFIFQQGFETTWKASYICRRNKTAGKECIFKNIKVHANKSTQRCSNVMFLFFQMIGTTKAYNGHPGELDNSTKGERERERMRECPISVHMQSLMVSGEASGGQTLRSAGSFTAAYTPLGPFASICIFTPTWNGSKGKCFLQIAKRLPEKKLCFAFAPFLYTHIVLYIHHF